MKGNTTIIFLQNQNLSMNHLIQT